MTNWLSPSSRLKSKKMSIRRYFSLAVLGVFPIFELLSYEVFRRKIKTDFSLRKRNPGLIYLACIAGWLAYINLVNSLFGGIRCCIYYVFTLLVAPLSVGPQLLRGILLWGMLEHNRLMLEHNEFADDVGKRRRSSRSSECTVATPVKIEEPTPQGISVEVSHAGENSARVEHQNQKFSSKEKAMHVKDKMRVLVQITFRGLFLIPAVLVFILLISSNKEQLLNTDFEQCFPEPMVVTYAGRSLGAIIASLTLVTTVLVRRCNDELGIRREISRNVLLLFTSYVLIFLVNMFGYSEWQSVLQSLQQMILTFSMIDMPCLHTPGVISWIQSKRKRALLGYGQPIPTISPRKTSILIRRMSEKYAQVSNSRSREFTMSLDAGFCILLSSADGLKAFTEHCSREFSVENIYFWVAVNEFHAAVDFFRAPGCEDAVDHNENDIKSFAQEIFDVYVQPNAEYQINISSTERLRVQKQIASSGVIHRDIFDQAQKEIFAVMSRDSYRRFLASDYHEKRKKNNSGRALRVSPA